MTTNQLVHIHWNGKESIDDAIQLIDDCQNFELDLPASYHHTFFRHISPNADPDSPEFVDIENGVELLNKIAEITGLELIGKLIEPVKKAGAKVIVISPTPRIFIGH